MKALKRTSFEELVEQHLQIALREVGPIVPWYDDEVAEWVFSHDLYPESYGGTTPQEVIDRYPLYLRQFIEHRLAGNLAPFVEQRTRGRGGKRIGAGRPKGRTKAPTRTVRLPEEVAVWIKSDPAHLEKVRRMMPRRGR